MITINFLKLNILIIWVFFFYRFNNKFYPLIVYTIYQFGHKYKKFNKINSTLNV